MKGLKARLLMLLAILAMLLAVSAGPAMADDFDHLGNFRGIVHDHDDDHDDDHNGDEEEIDIDRLAGGCFAVIEEEDHEEDLKAIYCPRVNVFGNVEYVRVD
jgi:hypothetical protein